MSLAIALVFANVAWYFIQSGAIPAHRPTSPTSSTLPQNEDLVTLPSTVVQEPITATPPEHIVTSDVPITDKREAPALPTKPSMFDPNKVVEVETKPVLMCFEIGPYLNRKQTESVRRELGLLGARVVIETRVKRVAAGYWVFLPPERSAALGRLKVEEIKTKGINDVVLVQKGEPKYAISLGVFKHKNTAERRLEQATSLGYEAKLEQWYTEDPQVWLNVSFPQIVMDKVDWTKYIDPAEGVQYAPMECPP